MSESSLARLWLPGSALGAWRGRHWLVRALTSAAAVGVSWWAAQLLLLRLRRARRVRIEGLFVYPIKGCRGHALSSVELTPWGLKGDRQYMIVSDKDNFITQRELPRMALIHPELATAEGVMLRAAPRAGGGAAAPADLAPAPLFVARLGEGAARVRQVKIWDDTVPGLDQGDAAASWLQTFLGKEGLRLVLFADSTRRRTDPAFGSGETAFADGFPVLLTSQASVDDVNRRIGGAVCVDQASFRPNIHVSGCRAFEEDEMPAVAFRGPPDSGQAAGAEARVPSARLRLVKPCSRCTVPTVNQRTALRQAGGEPLRTLRRYRTAELLRRASQLHRAFFSRPELAGEAYFGQNALVEVTPGTVLKLGDVAEVEW